MSKRHLIRIGKAEQRRLSVAADVDPRTLIRVANGAPLTSEARQRAYEVLRGAGYLVELAQAPEEVEDVAIVEHAQ